MLVLWLVVLGILLIALLPVKTHVTFTQRAWSAEVQIHVALGGMVHLRRSVNVSDKIALALEHMWKRWRATGEPVKIPLQKTVRRFPQERVMKAARPPIRRFRRHVHVERLRVQADIGGFDAMQSALLSGFAYSLVGVGLSQVSRLVQLDPKTPQVAIQPVFQGPAYRVQIDCILRYRLGNAMVAGVWLLARCLADREIRLWARDSWRRKGVEGSGRTSDSGADEDGHGEP